MTGTYPFDENEAYRWLNGGDEDGEVDDFANVTDDTDDYFYAADGATDDDPDLFFFSDWFQNGTFNYDEYLKDVSTVDSKIQGYSDIAFRTFLKSTALNVIIFVFFMILYELLRKCFPNVYASRQEKEATLIAAKEQAKEANKADGIEDEVETVVILPKLKRRRFSRLKNLPVVTKAEMPFQWVGKVFGVSWKQVREAVGLDAYFYLRYIRMCLKITSVSALWAMFILFPVYASGKNNAVGWYHVSLTNVCQGSSIIWVSILYIYFFTFFVLFVMKQELKHFVDLRLDFLGKGDGLTEPQHQYSVIVENIPKELRGAKALYNYFDKLFPGKVYCSSVILKVPQLEALSQAKASTTRALEKAIAFYEATGKRPTHITGRRRTVIDGIELLPSDIWQDSDKIVDLDMHYREQQSVELKKGVRVDSIDYHTRKLQHVNNKMFLLQKAREEQADMGDKSLRGFDKWFTTLSSYVDKVFHDLGTESNDEDDDSTDSDISTSSWSTLDGFSTSEDSHPFRNRHPRRMSSAWNSPETKRKIMRSLQEEGSIRPHMSTVKFADNLNSSCEYFPFPDEADLQPKESKHESTRGISYDLESRIELTPSRTQQSHSSLLSYGSDVSESTKKSSGTGLKNQKEVSMIFPPFLEIGSDRSEASENNSSSLLGSTNDPNSILDKSFETIIRETNADGLKKQSLLHNNYNLETNKSDISAKAEKKSRACSCGSISMSTLSARRVSKVAGRCGFDFGAYLMKFLTRRITSVRDEEKIDVMSSTGFVTFLDLATVTCVASAPLTHKPKTLNVAVAPERRDIIWENCSRKADINQSREFNANVGFVLGAVLWSVPLAGIQIFASADMLSKIPGLGWITEDGNEELISLINSYLPVVALLTLILILPYIFEAVAIYYEHRKTLSDVTRTTVSRYFYYQLANIYISVTAGSIWISASKIISRPTAALEILGESLPAVVGYFITLIVTKMLAGLPIIILRPYALCRYLFLRMIQSKKYMTQRELDNVYCLEPVYYGWEYPSQMLVIVICFTYACISPIILIFGAMYFMAALMVYKKQVLYVYTPFYESGGDLFPLVCDRTITGLICGQLTFMGYSIVSGGHILQILSALPLISFTFWVMTYFRSHYVKPSKRLTLEFAMELDDKIKERSESRGTSKYLSKVTIPQDSFTENYYTQPVMKEGDGEPLFYRIDRQDKMTKEVRQKLKRSRLHVWEPKRNTVLEEDTNDELLSQNFD